MFVLGQATDLYEAIDGNHEHIYENGVSDPIYENEQNGQQIAFQGQINAAAKSDLNVSSVEKIHDGNPDCKAIQDVSVKQYEQLQLPVNVTQAENKTKPPLRCEINRKIIVIFGSVILLLIVVVMAIAVFFMMQKDGGTSSDNASGWAKWSSWGSCSVSCGGTGTRERLRLCTETDDENLSACPGSDRQIKNCSTPCPVNGAWSQWSSWSSCSVTCGKGTLQRTRSCKNPAPQYGGQQCHGPDEQTETCIQSPVGCSAPVCFDSYTTLNESYRRESVKSPPRHCDQNKVDGSSWYRFDLETGENGVIEHCPRRDTCGARAPIWMKTSHPTEFGVIKDVTMAASLSPSHCTHFSGTASVTKCRVDGEVFYQHIVSLPIAQSSIRLKKIDQHLLSVV